MDGIKQRNTSRPTVPHARRAHVNSSHPTIPHPSKTKQRASHKAYWLVRSLGKTAATKSHKYRKILDSYFVNSLRKSRRHQLYAGFVTVLFIVSMVAAIVQPFLDTKPYRVSEAGRKILPRQNTGLGKLLTYDSSSQKFEYNKGYAGEVVGDSGAERSGTPRFTATIAQKNPSNGVQVTDTISQTSFSIKPTFKLLEGKKEENQVIYKLGKANGYLVYTAHIAAVKEDILLEEYREDKMEFDYELELPNGLEARVESDGSIGVYGSSLPVNGNVSTGSEEDVALLEKVRSNSKKDKLIFEIPAPVVVGPNKKASTATSYFELNGKHLKLVTIGLETAKYPLSIDPTVYIETAQKLMRGNNETNADFDTSNELIQKSQTTGARIDAWQGNLDFNNGTWDHGVAAAGGYIYRSGGRTDPTKPQIVDQTETFQNSDSGTFTMNMPTTRPANDLYLALMCYDGEQGDGSGGSTAGNNISTPTGWTKYAGRNGHAAYYKVGTDQGGGNESASYQFTGDSEEWGGVIIRVTGVDTSDPISGTDGEGHSGSNVTPVFPTTTPDSESTLVIRAVGADADEVSSTAWVPAGHTKIASGSSTGTGDCAFASASLDTSPASGVATGTATFADASISDIYGASSIAINPTSVTPATEDAVQWAKFNSTTLAIESPNPGNGACSGWCTNSAYDLPEARRGHSMVAYNGYLYVIGGTDGTNRESTVLIAKIGANGEPQLWHPTGGTPVYWYTDTGLNGATARSYLSAVAYNNRMYVLGGQTNASSGGVTTVEYADINPNGTLSTWTAGTSLPSARHGHTVHIYNDVMYLIGGNSAGALQSSVHYVKISSNGGLNSWTATTSFTTARSSFGGSFTTVWGAYIYLTGGCSAVNGSGYCTTVASDTQLGSINADGSISEWGSITNLSNQRIGYSIIGWQNGLYRLGGCSQQNTSTGACINALADVDYGTINPAGEVSTVNISTASGSGDCTGASPYNCNIPDPGDDAGEGGDMLSMTAILNGYLYHIGGCIDLDCSGTSDDHGAGDDADVSGNTSYVQINSNGQLTAPSSCSGTSYGSWCVDSTNRINGTTGVAAGGVTTFGNRIYVVGGLTGVGISTNIYYNDFNTDGSLNGAWESVDLTTAGVAEDVAYTYVFARANPSSAGSNPGNLYVIGGCGNNTGGAGCGGSDYETEVYKCNITTTGSVSGCTTTGQLQIDVELGDETNQGLGIHSGTVYANYIYLVGGYSPNVADRDTVFYAKIDNSNNIVDAVSGLVSGNDEDWIESGSTLSVGRRRGWAFGYNGHIYSLGGYDASGTGIIPFIEWSKMNVSDGSIDPFVTSSVQINQRWGLSVVVSNSYAYVFGGCDSGASPSSCTSFEPAVQTFQLYNNDSGALNDFTAQSDDTFATDTDRWGASSAIYNGYIYVAGGCISATDCTDATNDVQYASIDANDGTIGTWTNASNDLPADRAWGSLEVAGGYLYYLGGQDDTATNEQSAVYYVGSFSSGNISAAWSTASGGVGDTSGQVAQSRTKFGSAVWNNRIYVVGGLDGSAAATNTVFVSPQLDSGGDMAVDSWTSSTAFNITRTGGAVTAYANNLYLFGGFDGTNYLSDSQYTQINSDGTVDSWNYSSSLPGPLRDAKAVSSNGYIYLVGGRSAASTCSPNVLITPISANTTIISGNNPTGTGEWYETNTRYTGDRYGAAVAYEDGKLYTMGGGCSSPLSSARHYYSTVKSQPQVAIYSRMIDTDTDVFPTSWLMNGVDNSIGARWQVRYRSMHDISDGAGQQNPNEDCGTSAAMPIMTTWGQDTNYGDVTLGDVATYTPKDSSGGNINCARYYYFFVTIDASKTFGYPEDVDRGPTIADLSLFFTSDPSKRLKHGKTFTGGEQQPLDTPCRQSVDADCPLP